MTLVVIPAYKWEEGETYSQCELCNDSHDVGKQYGFLQNWNKCLVGLGKW